MSALSERYARAIFELASESGQVTQVSDQVQRFASVYAESEELRKVLGNPTVQEEKRDALIKDLAVRLGLSQIATDSLRLIADRRRMNAIVEIAAELRRLADDKAGILRATVLSAGPLPESYFKKLEGELEKLTNRKIVLEKKEDPSLIAGVVTRIGDRTIDGSLKGRLAALERRLVASA